MRRGLSGGVVSRRRGFGLLEFLVALLLFSTAVTGLLSTQLAGQRATHAALQSSVALSLARDVLARIEANAAATAAYLVTELGVATPETPEIDCRHFPCTPTELARFDLWQVAESLGISADGSYLPQLARLTDPRLCISRSGDEVTVLLSWRAHAVAPGVTGARCPAGATGRREVALSTSLFAAS